MESVRHGAMYVPLVANTPPWQLDQPAGVGAGGYMCLRTLPRTPSPGPRGVWEESDQITQHITTSPPLVLSPLFVLSLPTLPKQHPGSC